MVLEILYAFVFLLVSLLAGRKILLRLLKLKFSSVHEELVFSAGFGLAFSSFAIFALAALHLLYAEVFYLFFAAVFLFCLPELNQLRTQSKPLFAYRGFLSKFKSHRFSTAILLMLAAFLVIQFVSVLAPPASAVPGPKDWDSLTYHLSVPKLYAENHGFYFIDSIPHSNWPMLVEMLYLPMLLLKNAIAARLISFAFACLLMLALYLFSRQFLGERGSILATAIFFLSPTQSFFFGSGYVDLPLTFYSLLAIFAFYKWFLKPSENFSGSAGKWLLASAFLAGFSASSKLIGVYTLAILVLGVFVKMFFVDKGKFFASARQTLLFGVVSLLPVLPWFLKTYLYKGNPVWPLYYGFFQYLGFSSTGTEFFNSSWAKIAAGAGVNHSLLGLFLAPFDLVLHGAAFNGIISPLFLALVPLLFLVKKSNAGMKWLLAYSVIFVVPWFFSYQESRFLFPALLAVGLVGAYAFENARLGGKAKLAAMAIMLLVFLSSLGALLYYKPASFPVALGLESREHYLQTQQYNYETFQYANANLPASSKVFLFLDQQGYYLHVPYALPSLTDVDSFHIPNDAYAYLKQNGFTHVSVNTNDAGINRKDGILFSQMLAEKATLVHSARGVFLYELH